MKHQGSRIVTYLLAIVGVGSMCALGTGLFEVNVPSFDSFGSTVTAKTNNNGTPMLRKMGESSSGEKSNAKRNNNCLDPNGPLPVVLMSLGRSGTASTWQIISNITGYETRSVEYTGSGPVKSKAFVENILDSNPKGTTDYGDWVTDYICKQQQKYPQAGVVGFKWKPWTNTFYSKPMTDGLHRIVEMADSGTPIKVIRSRRNVLDVYMSRVKHAQLSVPAHCEVGDDDCIRLHTEFLANQKIPSPDVERLHDDLFKIWSDENNVDRYLEEQNVPVVHVSFEKMYFPSTKEEGFEEWKRIFEFILGVENELVKNLTWETIEHAMGHAATSSMKPHREILGNYDDVRAMLEGTAMEHVLRE